MDILHKMEQCKNRLKELKCELEEKMEKTDMFKKVFEQTMNGDYQISERDARKHALSVCIKNLKE